MLQNDYSWYMLKLSKLGAFSSAFLKAIEKIKRRYEVLLVTMVKCTGDTTTLSQIWYSSIIQTISFSQTSWQRHLFLANASTAMHQSKGSSQWHGNTKFTKFSIILWCSCSKVWRSEDYPVGVADKQGVRGVLCTTRCKQYLCQKCTWGRKRALHFSEKLRQMPWTPNKYPKTAANTSHVQPQGQNISDQGRHRDARDSTECSHS